MSHSVPEYHADAPNDGGYTSTVLGMNPYRYFPFNEAAGKGMDERRGASGNGYSGTVVYQVENAVRGDSSKGVTFDGSASYGSLTAMGNLGQNLGSGVSVSFFYSSSDATPGDMLGTRAPSSMSFRILINVGSVSGIVKIFLRDNVGSVVFGHHTDATINDGKRHHVFVSVSPGANAIVYRLDGVNKTITYEDQETPSSFANFSNTMLVGAANLDGTVGRWMNSTYGHLAFWNRILSVNEASELYNGAA